MLKKRMDIIDILSNLHTNTFNNYFHKMMIIILNRNGLYHFNNRLSSLRNTISELLYTIANLKSFSNTLNVMTI